MYQLSVLVHLVSAVVWVGGMLFLALVVVPATRSLPALERGRLIGAIGRRFRTVGWICIGLLAVTGTINAGYRGVTWEQVATGNLLASPFGQLLGVKLLLVALMVGISAVHDFVLGPAATRIVERGHPKAMERAETLRRGASWLGRINTFLGLLVLALAVALVRGLPR